MMEVATQVNRRHLLWGAGSVGALVAIAPLSAGAHRRVPPPLLSPQAIEEDLGGRVGFHAYRLGSDRPTLSHRGDERFAMCSTFKWLLAAFVLRETPDLSEVIPYTEKDLISDAPVTKPALNQGRALRTVDLCEAAVSVSDNTAANLLLAMIGGPEGFTARCRALGLSQMRLDRWELELNENAPGDPRDTTTPADMSRAMALVLFSGYLPAPRKWLLRRWMIGATTGLSRLRAGVPKRWQAGDKTGTSGNGAYNDVAFVLPVERRVPSPHPVLISSFINAPNAPHRQANTAHSTLAQWAIDQLTTG